MYTKKYKEVYEPKIGTDSTDEIIKRAHEVVIETLSENELPNLQTGLLVGKVQSGKTSNFLGIIADAFDNNYYDTVFLIGGVDKDLLNQNKERIDEVYKDVRDERNYPNCGVYTSTEMKKFTYGLENELFFVPERNKKVIITILKSATHLDTIYKIIKNNPKIWSKRKVLIIDDEGDQGSLNGNANTNKEDVTKWNKLINKIREELTSFSYIAVTATPYANVLIETYDSLSPKFVKLTYPGEGYCGLSTFHSEEGRKKFIRIVPDDEADRMKGDGPQGFAPFIKIEKSLEEALSFFICSSIDLVNKGTNIERFEMLLNVVRKNTNHAVIKNQITNFFVELRTSMDNYFNDKSDIEKLPLIAFINKGFELLYGKKINETTDESFLLEFKYALEDVDAVVINGSKEATRISDGTIKNKHVIYIGSDLLSRGVTINNLIVTFITRDAIGKNNADTILQRARWFGYREKFLDNMKIYTTQKIARDYFDIWIMENNLWEFLERIDYEGLTNEEWIEKIFLELPTDKLRPTRRNVAKVNEVKMSSWIIQRKYFETKPSEQIYFEKVNEEKNIEQFGTQKFCTKEYSNWKEFSLITSIDSFIINKVLSNREQSVFDGNWQKLPVKVILMQPQKGGNSQRSLGTNKNFTLHGQGANTKVDLTNQSVYFGDSKIDLYDANKGKIIVQIYKVDFTENDSEYSSNEIAYALYVPSLKISGYTRS